MVRLFEKQFVFFLLLAMTLGLAPFAPEPHIVGKVRWVAGGAVGMGAKDWFDLFFHGIPWVLFFISLVFKVRQLVLKNG
ncbi:MAG: hypothetical protein HUJ25_11120 [Crocinitomicaceae bacterium]|nr:hypothetical protein [Crocinitomicaceae bacterium]